MKSLYELKEMLCYELDEIVKKGELSAGSLETVHKLTDTIKNIDKIEMLEEEGGYSEEGSYEGGGSYARGGRGRGRNAKRDNMGRYSRDGYSREGYSRDGYSREGSYESGDSYGRGGGYSREGGGMMYSRGDGKEHLMRDIREMMEEARNEKEREAYRRAMKELENV